MFKCISAIPFGTFFQLDNNNRTRGHSAKIKKNRYRTDLRKQFFSERGPIGGTASRNTLSK